MGWFYIDRNGNEQAWSIGQSLPHDCRWNSARFFNQFRVAILERAAACHVATSTRAIPLYTPFAPGDNAQSAERHAQIHRAIELLLDADDEYLQDPDAYMFANHSEAIADAIQAQAQFGQLRTKTDGQGILESIPEEYIHDLSTMWPYRGRRIELSIYETWHNILTAIPHTGAMRGAIMNMQTVLSYMWFADILASYGRLRLYTYNYDAQQWNPPLHDDGPWQVSSYETKETVNPFPGFAQFGWATQWGSKWGGPGYCSINEFGIRLRGKAAECELGKSMRISVVAYPYVARFIRGDDDVIYRDPREHGMVEGLPAPGEAGVVATADVGTGAGYFTLIERFMENVLYRNNTSPPFTVGSNNAPTICYGLVSNLIQVQSVLNPSFPSIYEGEQ